MGSEENPIVKAALDVLPLYGVDCWRNNQVRVPGRRFNGKKGVADVLGITRLGLMVAVEGKKPDGELSGDQEEFLDMVRSRGGVAIVASSIPELYQEIQRYQKRGLL